MEEQVELEIGERVRTVFGEFAKVQNKYGSYGAGDTEPDGVAQFYLAHALGLRAREPRLPVTPRDWELYEGIPGVGRAAKALTTALKRLEARLKKLWWEPGARQAIRERLWRVG